MANLMLYLRDIAKTLKEFNDKYKIKAYHGFVDMDEQAIVTKYRRKYGMCDTSKEINRVVPAEWFGGTCHDWMEDMIEKTAKQEAEKEASLVKDLNKIYTNHGNEMRSLANLIHERYPDKKLIYDLVKTDDWWIWRWVIVDAYDISNHPLVIAATDPRFTRKLNENAAENTIRQIYEAKSLFKSFINKRRK